MTYAELSDRGSAAVQDALTRTCELCGAPPGEDCRSIIKGRTTPPGRIVDYARTAR
ncbi:zinc finger domain-containing protein [Mycobacterium malmoense]|uniref:zinc finger domain-containing protein n=1 Tax=Mycobacterium malmoense TaxID=1780 RepID=UPI0015A526F3|nr:hypothetical protein [Mycobacterium malmoense]